MSPESAGHDVPSVVVVDSVAGRVVLAGAELASLLEPVLTTTTLLTADPDPSPDEVAAMARRLEPGGWVAGTVPVTDALKTVEGGTVTGSVDRTAVVAARLPVLAPTAVLRSIADTAGDRVIDLIEALASTGPGTAHTTA